DGNAAAATAAVTAKGTVADGVGGVDRPVGGNATTATTDGSAAVAAKGAVDDSQYSSVIVNAAADGLHAVTGEVAVGNGQHPDVVNAGAVNRFVGGEGAVGDSQRTFVVNAAAVKVSAVQVEVTVSDCQIVEV